eukprot:9485655-Pyramimonas_sp.AAC.1
MAFGGPLRDVRHRRQAIGTTAPAWIRGSESAGWPWAGWGDGGGPGRRSLSLAGNSRPWPGPPLRPAVATRARRWPESPKGPRPRKQNPSKPSETDGGGLPAFSLMMGLRSLKTAPRWPERVSKRGPRAAQEHPKSAPRGHQEAHLKAPRGER